MLKERSGSESVGMHTHTPETNEPERKKCRIVGVQPGKCVSGRWKGILRGSLNESRFKHVQRLIAHYDWRLFIGQPVSAVDAK